MITQEIPVSNLTIRHELRPGDIGTIVKRHGEIYHQEYGWDHTFEALAASVVSMMVENYDPARERHWIAEIDGEFAGCVFMIRNTDEQAKLRCLLVDSRARGLGLGTQLVQECIAFARDAGYRSITLWTKDVLVPARRIYARAGFRCVHSWHDSEFGADLMSETWELTL